MRNENNDADENARIDHQAAAWVARRLSGDFSDRDRAELEAWLAQDARHSIAFKDYLALANTGSLAGLASGAAKAANDEPALGKRKTRRWLIAAPAIAASLFAASVFLPQSPTVEPSLERFATDRGELRDVILADGSIVTLNTDTVLTVTFSDAARFARLEQGEAFFDITRDTSRPFTVEANGAKARVLGTSFTVLSDGNEANICVHSGRVAVTPTAIGANDSFDLTAGETVSISVDQGTGTLATFDPDLGATWREGYLAYQNEPLQVVVTELNRYYKRQIRLDEPSLGTVPVTGRFDINDQRVAVEALSIALALRAENRGPSEIILKADD